MAAYLIFIRDEPVHDEAEMAEYQRLNRERGSDGFDVKRLAFYGAADALEGPAPDGVVVLEFPSVEEARAWYQSPGYQAALQHRLKATTYRVIITEGVSRFGPSRHGVEAHTARTRARYDTREMASISNLVVVGLQAAIRGPS